MAGFDESPVDHPENLLRSSRALRRDRRERIGDAEDGQAHVPPLRKRKCPPDIARQSPTRRIVT